MGLIDQIKDARKTAMLARDNVASTLLGTLLGAIQTKETTFNPRRELADDEIIAQIKKMLDNLHEIVGHLTGKPDRAADLIKAQTEIAILSAYMPKQMNEEAIETFLRQKVAEGVTGIGPLMAALKSHAAGSYDGKTASIVAKRVLS